MYQTEALIGKNRLMTKYHDLFGLNLQLRLLVENKWKDLEKHHTIDKRFPEQGVTTFLLGKAYKTHGTVLNLCMDGYGEDAGVLARTLFELAVNLLYLNKEDSTNRATMFGEHEWVLRLKLLDSNLELIKSSGKMKEERIDEIRNKVDELITKYGKKFKRSWSLLETKEMAKEVGLEGAYNSVYTQFTDIAHSRISSASEYVREDSAGLVIDIGPGENLVPTVLVSAFHHFLLIVDSWDIRFSLGLDNNLSDLSKRFDEVVSKLSE